MLLAAAVQHGQKFLSPHDTARIDSELLLTIVLHQSREFFLAHSEKKLTLQEQQDYQALLHRRKQGEPIAYLLGYKEFWALKFSVDHNVLIPRPETELLVGWLLTVLSNNAQYRRIAELGVGSGAIAISVAKARPHWDIYATDVSAAALKIAQKNSVLLATPNINFYQGSWYQALPPIKFDAIVSNPPYVALREWEHNQTELSFEPKDALVSNHEGFGALQEIINGARDFLNPGGYLAVEHGINQAGPVQSLLQDQGYCEIVSYNDLQGIARITVGMSK